MRIKCFLELAVHPPEGGGQHREDFCLAVRRAKARGEATRTRGLVAEISPRIIGHDPALRPRPLDEGATRNIKEGALGGRMDAPEMSRAVKKRMRLFPDAHPESIGAREFLAAHAPARIAERRA